jgi:hypothetical protein
LNEIFISMREKAGWSDDREEEDREGWKMR